MRVVVVEGRAQVELTAQRLRRMNLTYVSITHSTLERAVETAEIIRSHLRHVAVTPDEMLVEGGPVPPNPTISYWRLPDRVRFMNQILAGFSLLIIIFVKKISAIDQALMVEWLWCRVESPGDQGSIPRTATLQ